MKNATTLKGRTFSLTPLFGAPSADNDHLLSDCRLEEQIDKYQDPIVLGRWGTGKTAILISRARYLEQVLKSVDPLKKRDWYIREQDLQPESIFALQQKFSESPDYLNSSLQRVWKSEIYRRVALILATLSRAYSTEAFVEFNHWKSVKAIALKEQATESFWSCIGSVMDVIFSDRNVKEAANSFAQYFDELTSAKMSRDIQRCIIDLEDHRLAVPVIGIEPLETPASDLDQKIGLAESVIAALLNCYRNDFIFAEDQRIRINISIPWNRINNSMVNLPQHLTPYQAEVSWDKESLRQFINRRIEREARDAGAARIQVRPNNDAWDNHFVKTIGNKTYSDNFMRNEETFSYVCRHTLWRARDLQTISREAVMSYCNANDISTRDFFRKGHKVDAETLRVAVSRNSRINAKLRIEEARRRYKFKFDVANSLYGMKVPFAEGDLKARIDEGDDYKTWNARLDALWESGIIGLSVEIFDPNTLRLFESRFGTQSFRRVSYKAYIAVGFVFQYNSEANGSPLSIREMLVRESKDTTVNFIIHPTFNEALDLHLIGDYPLGC